MSICTASTICMHTRVTASSVLILVPHSNRCSFPLVSGCVKSDGDSSDSGGWSEEEGSEEDNVSTLHSADTNVQCPVSNVHTSTTHRVWHGLCPPTLRVLVHAGTVLP